jgi:hypothetical protein
MKSTMSFMHVSVAALVLGTATFLIAAENHSVQPNDFTVHEWGTFTSVAGEDGSAIEWDTLGCRSDLPEFVHDYSRVYKSGLRGTVRMETPVMYFYSPSELDAQVKVEFPQGQITEWYPQANIRSGAIEWRNIKIQPNTSPALPRENGPSRYYAARATDSAPIAIGDQHEKFLFYRGVGRFAVPLSARLSSDGKIAIENRGADPVPGMILFENRGGRFGYRNIGAVEGDVTLNPPSLDGSFSQLRHELETTLVTQGLFPKEAQAMVETWRDSWFEEGSRLIYIVPSRAIDAILPLQVDPAPSQTARVFVGRIELITSETRRSVEQAIATRDRSTIERYGRFLDSILQRISSESPSMASQVAQFRNIQASLGAGVCR